MQKIATVCRVLSFRKRRNKGSMHRQQSLTHNVVGKSAAEVMEQEIADAIPEPERML